MVTTLHTPNIKHTCSLLIGLLLMGQSLCLSAAPKQKGVAFDVGIGAGYSTLGYQTQATDNLQPRVTGSWGMRANIGINYFFLDYLGIGIGVSLTRYGGGLSVDGEMVWEGVTDTDGERYNHHLQLNNWRETQQQLFIAPNLTLQAAIPAGNAHVLIRFGAEYAACMQASYSGYGELTHTGYYPFGNLTLHDIEKYGFYTTDRFRPSGELSADVQQVSLIGAVGVGIPVAKNTELTIAVEAAYAVWSSNKTPAGGENAIGFHENISIDPTNGNNSIGNGQDPHYFIPDYVSLTTTSLTQGAMHPLYVGLQIGVRYTIPQRKRYPCMCLKW
ncbi:MAG: hypothetical protein ACI30J_05230 [Paludibacteraceae bacterium]